MIIIIIETIIALILFLAKTESLKRFKQYPYSPFSKIYRNVMALLFSTPFNENVDDNTVNKRINNYFYAKIGKDGSIFEINLAEKKKNLILVLVISLLLMVFLEISILYFFLNLEDTENNINLAITFLFIYFLLLFLYAGFFFMVFRPFALQIIIVMKQGYIFWHSKWTSNRSIDLIKESNFELFDSIFMQGLLFNDNIHQYVIFKFPKILDKYYLKSNELEKLVERLNKALVKYY